MGTRWAVLALGLAGLVVAGVRCRASDARADARGRAVPQPTLTSVRIVQTAAQLWVRGYWTVPSGATSLVDSAGPNAGSGAQGHTLPATARSDSFAFPAPAAGTTLTGYFGVKACNAGGCSAMSFKAWSYTAPVPPPAPPTLDSVRVFPAVALALPAGSTQQFCAFGFWSDGHVERDQKPLGHPGASYCDSVGRVRFGPRYLLGRVWRPWQLDPTLARLAAR